MKMKNYLVLAIGLLLSINALAQQTTVESAVNTLISQLIDPTEEGLKAISHENLTYGHSNGKIENQAEFMEALLSASSDFTAIRISDQKITMSGKVATVRHLLDGDTLNGGQAGNVKIKVLTVWVKSKGKWVLLARQAVR